jgi:hypothetical protein
MEVHTHTHTPRKKWTHYFWEFLMLFLAVFCGFLAENQREHMIEHQREKRFAVQLLTDLTNDSVHFSFLINRVSPRIYKSAGNLNELLTRQPASTDKEVILALSEVGRIGLQLTNTTFTQMKTSGTLRYIRNDSLTRLLSKYYDVLCARVIHSWEESRDFYNDYLLPFRLKHIKSQDFFEQSDSLITHDPAMIDRTAKTDQELLNYINSYNSQITSSLINNKCKPALEEIKLLIPMLKKEYHL